MSTTKDKYLNIRQQLLYLQEDGSNLLQHLRQSQTRKQAASELLPLLIYIKHPQSVFRDWQDEAACKISISYTTHASFYDHCWNISQRHNSTLMTSNENFDKFASISLVINSLSQPAGVDIVVKSTSYHDNFTFWCSVEDFNKWSLATDVMHIITSSKQKLTLDIIQDYIDSTVNNHIQELSSELFPTE